MRKALKLVLPILVLAAGFAVLMVATGVYVAGRLSDRVTEEFDAALVTKANALVALTEQEEGQIELDYSADHMPEFEREAESTGCPLRVEVPSDLPAVYYDFEKVGRIIVNLVINAF